MLKKLGITPGPWVFTSDDQIKCNDEYVYPYEDGSRESIAMIWDDEHFKVGSKESNALLIAASPEMLEALIEIRLAFETPNTALINIDKITKTIQKATGKPWSEIKELI